MADEKKRGPYCSVAGCTELAIGALMRRDPKDWYRFLCTEHIEPVHAALNEQLKKGHRDMARADVA